MWHQIERFFKNGRLFTLGLYKAQKDELKSLQPKREELEIVEQQLIECEKEARNCAAALKKAGDGVVAEQLQQDRVAVDRHHDELAARRKALLIALGARRLTDEAIASLLKFREDMVRGVKSPTNEDKRRFYERIGLTVDIDGPKAQIKCLIRRTSMECYMSTDPRAF